MLRRSVPLKKLEMLCAARLLDPDTLAIRSKMLLKLYRSVVSVILDKVVMTVRESCTLYKGEGSFAHDIQVGLTYLADFEPEYEKKEFAARVSVLFESQWMIELMNNAIERVHMHLEHGDEYYEILYKCYFDKHRYRNDDLQDTMVFAHTSYFDCKREAILLFGIYLWGYEIPELYRKLSEQSDLQHAKKAY